MSKGSGIKVKEQYVTTRAQPRSQTTSTQSHVNTYAISQAAQAQFV